MSRFKDSSNHSSLLFVVVFLAAMINDSGSLDTKSKQLSAVAQNDGVAMYTNELFMGSTSTGSRSKNPKLSNSRASLDYPDYNADYDNLPLHAAGFGGGQQFRKNFQQQQQIIHTKEVAVKQGRLKGLVRLMHIQSGLQNVDQFLGIPYAEAPVDRLRFMPPGAPVPWTGLKLATKFAPVCPQNLPDINNPTNTMSKGRFDQIKRLLPYLKHESEDCLYLNLYVPSLSKLKNLFWKL